MNTMFSPDEYQNLTSKYGAYSSWAIWSYEEPSDTTIIETNSIELNSRFVLLGLNMSRLLDRPAWFNFHDNTHARKLKYACNDTKLRGSYMTDIFKDMIDPNSINFEKQVSKEEIDKNAKLFNQEMIDIKINDDTQFIVFGSLAFRYFNKYFKQGYVNNVMYHSHYSSWGTDKEWVERFWKKLNIDQNFDSTIKKYK